MGERGEAWLQQGVDHIVRDSCPYCGQSVQGLPLIDAYRKVFADSYREMKAAVERTRTSVERDFGDRATGSIDMFFEANRGTVEFWSRYCKLPQLAALNYVSKAVSDLGVAALALLAAKAAAPQEAVAPRPDFSAALAQFEEARAAVYGYNDAIAAANAEINAKKTAVASGDIKKRNLRWRALVPRGSATIQAWRLFVLNISGSSKRKKAWTTRRPRCAPSWSSTRTR